MNIGHPPIAAKQTLASGTTAGLAPKSNSVALVYLPVLHAPREMGPLIDELIDRKWLVRIVVGTEGIDAEIQRWAARGAQIIRPPDSMIYKVASKETGRESPKPKRSHLRRFLAAILPSSAVRAIFVWRHYKDIGHVQGYARDLIKTRRPDVFVSTNFHSCGRLDGALLFACNRERIPSICILVSPLVGKAIARPGRLTQASTGMVPPQQRTDHDLFSRLFATLFPMWTVGDGTQRIFMWPIEIMLAAKLRSALPSDVWQEPPEQFDMIIAYNQFSRDLLERSGFPMGKVVAYNSIRLDETIRLVQNDQARAALYSSLHLPLNAPFIVWNIEPSWEHHYCDEFLHWTRIREMAKYFSLAEKPVVVSLHPLCDRNNYKFLEDEFGLHLATAGIHLLYPFCAFAVSFGCSTNQFAPAFGKRILMYDWFGIRADEHRWELYRQPQMEVVNTMVQFQAVLSLWVAKYDWGTVFKPEELPVPSAPLIAALISDFVVSRPDFPR